jgi:KDO2-lipid IV(A) lauroyltransferase
MTLVSRLALSTGATVLLAFGERLSGGRGYVIHIEPLQTQATTANLNAAVEMLVRRCPEQYLWSYPRYKVPRGAPKPPVKL